MNSLVFALCMSAPFFYQLLADLVVGIHFAFVLFVIFGGFLAAKWRRVMWLHISAAFWGAFVEFSGWICPLTPLENWLRQKAGEAGYRSDFVARYLLPVLYPQGLTRGIQIVLGALVVAVNLAIYGCILRSNMKRKV
ncbi:MAG: DUF2784 domain-containing protein [Alphaproteobacteria bacterium]